MKSLLTPEQEAEVKSEMVLSGLPVRFMIDGQSVHLTTGERDKKGINVIYQHFYWNFTKDTAKKIAGWIGAKAVFDA